MNKLLLALLTVSILSAETAYLVDSKQGTGPNQICYYNLAGTIYAINMSAYSPCPTTYEIKR